MKRYRKGQLFKPPTTNESAAIADAVEGFRMRPARPQDRSPTGQTVIVKTPEGGIPGRGEDGAIPWTMCKRVIQRGGSGDRELAPTDEQIPVYNILETPIPGDIYAVTALTECGVRYVVPEPALPPVQLKISDFFSSSGTNAGYFSEDAPISFKVTEPNAGSPTNARITILTPTAYQNPCFSVNQTGAWKFNLSMRLSNYSIPFPDWSGEVTDDTCVTTPSAFPGVGVNVVFENQAESGGDWNSIVDPYREGVYFFHANPQGPLHCSYSFAADLTAGDKIRISIVAISLGDAPSTSMVQIHKANMILQHNVT